MKSAATQRRRYEPASGSPRQAIALALIDDNRLLREGLAAMLRLRTEYRVVMATADADELLQTMSKDPPDIVLLDFGLADQDSLSLSVRLRADASHVKVIVMGLGATHEDIAAYVRAGVSGFIMKDASFDEFTGTINAVRRGEEVLPRALTHSLFAQIMNSDVIRDRSVFDEGVRLTAREQQIIDLLGQGLSNRDIATNLHIAIHTVKSHVHNILEKLSLRTRLEVAAFSHATNRTRDQ